MREPDDWRTSEDDAKRCYASINVHHLALSKDEIIAGVYVAVRLSDGGSDNTPYASRPDAIRHQSGNQNHYAYIKLTLDRPSVKACDRILWWMRKAYDNGYRPAGAHEGASLIVPILNEDIGERTRAR
jgi:hypothetical protein